MPDSLFSLNDGHQKGLTGRMNIGTLSKCTLITDEEAAAYIETWKRNREEKALREEIKAKFDTFTFEQLVKMKELL